MDRHDNELTKIGSGKLLIWDELNETYKHNFTQAGSANLAYDSYVTDYVYQFGKDSMYIYGETATNYWSYYLDPSTFTVQIQDTNPVLNFTLNGDTATSSFKMFSDGTNGFQLLGDGISYIRSNGEFTVKYGSTDRIKINSTASYLYNASGTEVCTLGESGSNFKASSGVTIGAAAVSSGQYGVKTAGTSYYFGNFENALGTSAGVSKTGVKLLEFFDADSSVLANGSLRAGTSTSYVTDYTIQVGIRPLGDNSTLQWVNTGANNKFNWELASTNVITLYSYISSGNLISITPNATLNLGVTNFNTRLQNSSGTIKKITSITSSAGSTNVTVSDDVVVVIGSTTHTLVITEGGTEYGRYHTLKNLSTGNVTVSRSGSDTFDSGTSLTLTQNQSIQLVYVSSNTWAVL
jgi:hypothetical protein